MKNPCFAERTVYVVLTSATYGSRNLLSDVRPCSTRHENNKQKQAFQYYYQELLYRAGMVLCRDGVVQQLAMSSSGCNCWQLCFFQDILFRGESQYHSATKHADRVVGSDGHAVDVAEVPFSRLPNIFILESANTRIDWTHLLRTRLWCPYTYRFWEVIRIRLADPEWVEVWLLEFA